MGRKREQIIEDAIERAENPRPLTGPRGTSNFPNNISAKAPDVQRVVSNLLKWYSLPRAVTDEEISERLLSFFTTCAETGEMMTMEKMGLALGYTSKTLWEWERGGPGSTTFRCNCIKKAKQLLSAFDAEMAAEGKINPVVYIFRAKNFFGMRDQQELLVTPNNPMGDLKDPEEIQRKYIEALPVDDEEGQ